MVNIDLQKVYTRTDLFKTAYETDPNQLDYVNQLAAAFREQGWPVVWTQVAYMESGEDCGIWGTRTDTPIRFRISSLDRSAQSLMTRLTSIKERRHLL